MCWFVFCTLHADMWCSEKQEPPSMTDLPPEPRLHKICSARGMVRVVDVLLLLPCRQLRGGGAGPGGGVTVVRSVWVRKSLCWRICKNIATSTTRTILVTMDRFLARRMVPTMHRRWFVFCTLYTLMCWMEKFKLLLINQCGDRSSPKTSFAVTEDDLGCSRHYGWWSHRGSIDRWTPAKKPTQSLFKYLNGENFSGLKCQLLFC